MTGFAALGAIKAVDYTVIYVRDMAAMRAFYEKVMGFAVLRALSPNWVEYQVGPHILTLAGKHPLAAADAPVPQGTAALQLAFRMTPSEVDACAAVLQKHGVVLVSPPTDQTWGHRTAFFRDPDGNLLEVFADI